MVYAQVSNGVVQNTIEVDESTPLDLFSEGFDYLLRIDEIEDMPGIGWLFDGSDFSRPPDIPLKEPIE